MESYQTFWLRFSVTININSGVVESISGVVGGTGYTYASVRFEAGTFGGKTLLVGTGAEFEEARFKFSFRYKS